MTIPSRVHFCWIGTSLPWAYVFAILSAAERSEMPEIILHHTDALDDGPERRALEQAPRVRLSRLDPIACLAEVEQETGIDGELVALYRSLGSPVMRADMLRVAILYLRGGIYLDLDTITTASFRPLLEVRQFVGTEFIVWPQCVRTSRSPIVRVRHMGLSVVRRLLRKMPQGWKAFRRIENFYSLGLNNAVMGGEARAPLFEAYLRAMPLLPPTCRTRPFALGPHMLQHLVAQGGLGDLTIYPPRVFYPMPPVISEHLFCNSRSVQPENVLLPETRVVHWYASVRTKSRVAQITPRYVRDHRDHQLYSALVCSCIRDLPDVA
ncbi:glycosyltransferase [Gluconacetobacter tumulisoli]|uniref:Glycosyl transferase n=1 Tax=Gluconacetobacter tumulisoli TaxID=1286189 RepID=A0A7W4K6J9_9PROT|nr:glycosyltransferase [Gluconacetobacter tumulisoli]MBB2201313.1 glycosyl transferase [Gluconacetobacter tumulisoli]